jgi:SAM-dependent methyltransferase
MDSTREFEHRFKAAVEKNFDQSADAYDHFEEQHHLFETLTKRQLELIEPSRPERVLDVGCGTGISTLALHQAIRGQSSNIYAIDISERMLRRARERCKSLRGVYFIRGDAEILSSYFKESFDAIFYTASIFLLPGFAESLRQACNLLVDVTGNDAIRKAFPDQKYQYGAVPIGDLVSCLESLPETRSTRIDYRFEVSREFLFDFLSIPAQSAGIFPKIPYLERIPKVRDFCDLLAKRVDPVFMGWEFLIARKR